MYIGWQDNNVAHTNTMQSSWKAFSCVCMRAKMHNIMYVCAHTLFSLLYLVLEEPRESIKE